MPTRRSAFLVVATLIPGPLLAVDRIVTRYDDPVPNGCSAGDCSLREAVVAANADVDFDRILLSAGRYELTQPGSDENAAGGDLEAVRPGRQRQPEPAGVVGARLLDASPVAGDRHGEIGRAHV